MPGRRYLIGKGEGCDIRVDGTYTSRRHAEIWLDDGAWWVADAGSTNGIRVEDARRAPPAGRQRRRGGAEAAMPPIRLGDGTRIVLSARAEGPRERLPVDRAAAGAVAPAARRRRRRSPAPAGAPKTPLTAMLPARRREPGFDDHRGAGDRRERTLEACAATSLPLTIGRSRNQALVIDRRHEASRATTSTSSALDDDGAHGIVHGDNGVVDRRHRITAPARASTGGRARRWCSAPRRTTSRPARWRWRGTSGTEMRRRSRLLPRA